MVLFPWNAILRAIILLRGWNVSLSKYLSDADIG